MKCAMIVLDKETVMGYNAKGTAHAEVSPEAEIMVALAITSPECTISDMLDLLRDNVEGDTIVKLFDLLGYDIEDEWTDDGKTKMYNLSFDSKWWGRSGSIYTFLGSHGVKFTASLVGEDGMLWDVICEPEHTEPYREIIRVSVPKTEYQDLQTAQETLSIIKNFINNPENKDKPVSELYRFLSQK